MAIENDPVFHRRRLRAGLRKARENADLTQCQAAWDLGWSLSKLIRIEAGSVRVAVTDLKAMLALYHVTHDDTVSRLTEAARGSKNKGGGPWRNPYRDLVTSPYDWYLGLERAASSICAMHPSLVPELAQTPDYATGLLPGARTTAELNHLTGLRARRQANLSGEPGPRQLTIILAEEALHRQVSGPAVMRAQLRYLLDITGRETATIQILPFSAGVHPGLLLGPSVLMGFADPGEDMLFTEDPIGHLVSHDALYEQDVVARFSGHFEAMRRLALPGDQARALISELIDRLGPG